MDHTVKRKQQSVTRAFSLVSFTRYIFGVAVLVTVLFLVFQGKHDDSNVGDMSDLMVVPATVPPSSMSNTTFPPTTPIRLNLPDMSKGGVIIFFHIPKTGGSSINKAAKTAPKVDHRSNQKRNPNGGSSMELVKEKVTIWTKHKELMVGEDIPVRFLELHWDLESVVSLDEQLTEWRETAAKNGVPFFVFTMVRDPLSTQISVFNFFCTYLQRAKKVKCPGPVTVERLLEVSPDNPQTRWLCYATTMNYDNKTLPSVSDCDIFGVAYRQFDWIGAMERFQETLVVLEAMGVKLEYMHTNRLTKIEKIEKSQLSAEEKARIKKDLEVDQAFVNWVGQTYTLEKFGLEPPLVKK